MIPNVCFPCENGTHRNEPHDNRYGPCECFCSQQPVPSGTQDEREREIRDNVGTGYYSFLNRSNGDIQWLLASLDAERKRVQELEGAFAKALKAWKYHAEDSDEFSAIVEAERVLLSKEQK